DIVRKIAKDKQVPLLDYFGAILERRPDDWDGAAPKFKDAPGDVYQVPTLISRDGVHPSNPQKYRDFSEEALKHNGFGLRSYLTLMAYADLIGKVLQPGKKPGAKPDAPAFPFDRAAAERYQQAYADWLGLPVTYRNGLGMTFVLVPPGTFRMGSPEE